MLIQLTWRPAGMDLSPLTHAPLPIQVHAYAALSAFVLGAVQLARAKGTTQHRALGYAWAAIMLTVAVSSFWVQEIRLWGPWSPIHLLSIFRGSACAGHPASAPPFGAAPSPNNDRSVLRSAAHRRSLHARSRSHHAQGPVRKLRYSDPGS